MKMSSMPASILSMSFVTLNLYSKVLTDYCTVLYGAVHTYRYEVGRQRGCLAKGLKGLLEGSLIAILCLYTIVYKNKYISTVSCMNISI